MSIFQSGTTQYAVKGGDTAMQRRAKEFQRMQAVARQRALLPEGSNAPEAEGLKGFFSTVVDLISRPNYASAGLFDTLAGNGKPGENAFERVFRETFSGIGALQGDKEVFDDVLMQAGVGEMGNLSDLIGENGLTRNFNPSTRGAVGLAMDIFLDPLTYISAPIKNAASVLGAGGEIRFLNKKGIKLLEDRYYKKLDEWRGKLPGMEDADEERLLDAIRQSPLFTNSLRESTAKLVQSEGFGAVEIGARLRREVGEEMIKEGTEEAFEKAGLRFRLPGGMVDIPLMADRLIGKGAGQVFDWMRAGARQTDITDAMWRHGSRLYDNMTKLFVRHPMLARQNKAFVRLEAARFVKFQSAQAVAGKEVDRIFAGVSKSQLDRDDVWEQFIRAVEELETGPQTQKFVEMAQGIGIENPQQYLMRWRSLFNHVGATEADLTIISRSGFEKSRDVYFPRLTGRLDKTIREQLEREITGFKDDLRQFSDATGFESWDAYKQRAIDLGAKERDFIVNPREVAVARLGAHYEALINQEFLEDVATRFGITQNKHVKRIREALMSDGGEVTAKETQIMMELEGRDSVFTGDEMAAARAERRKAFVEERDAIPVKIYRKVVKDRMEALRTGDNDAVVAQLQARIFDHFDRYKKVRRQGRLAEARSTRTSLQRIANVANDMIERFTGKEFDPDKLSALRDEAADILDSLDEIQAGLKEAGAFQEQGLLPKAEIRQFIKEIDRILAVKPDVKTIDEMAAEAGVRGIPEGATGEQILAYVRKLIQTKEQRVYGFTESLRLGKFEGAPAGAKLKAQINSSNRSIEWLEEFLKKARREQEKSFKSYTSKMGKDASNIWSKVDDLLRWRNTAAKQKREYDEEFEEIMGLLDNVYNEAGFNRLNVDPDDITLTPKQSGAVEEIDKIDRQLFNKLSPEAQRAYLGAAMGKIKSIDRFEKFMNKYAEDLTKLDDTLSETVDQVFQGKTAVLRDTYGQPFVQAKFGGKKYTVPQGIAEDLRNFNETFLSTPEVAKVLSTYDKLNNWFKVSVTRYFPSFHVRNAYSNIASVFTDIGLQALNPRTAREAFDILRGADGTIRLYNGRRMTFDALRREMEAVGIHVDKLLIAELTGKAGSDPVENLIQWRLRKEAGDEKFWRMAEKAYSVPNNVENHARAMHYISLRRKGFGPEDASHQVNKFLFDYSDLSSTEKGVFRRLFPFWTWTRKNAERQIRNLYERPGRVATQVKILAGDRGPEGDHLPEYLRGEMQVRLEQMEDGGEVWLTGIDLPISATNILWKGGIGKTFREQIGMLTPLIKMPIEVGTGTEFFSGEGTRGFGKINTRLGNTMARNMSQEMKDWFELTNVGTQDKPRWEANRLKVHLVMKGLFVSRIINQGVQLDNILAEMGNGDSYQGAKAAMKLLAGLDLRTYDLSEKNRAIMYNRAQRIEDMLVQKGLMGEYRKAYIREGVLPQTAQNEQQAAGGIFRGGTRSGGIFGGTGG